MSKNRQFDLGSQPNWEYLVDKHPNHSPFLVLCYDWVSSAVIAVVTVVLVFSCLFRIVNVRGDSMCYTLMSGDRLVISNLFYTPDYGDVVVITRPNDTPLIKRVIGIEGDRIRIDKDTGKVYRNDVELEETYVLGGFTPQNGLAEEITVPAGTLFVMGDNRTESLDSRMLGVQSMDNVVGRVLFRIAPHPGKIADGE